MNQQEEILSLFAGYRPAQIPCFSGLISVTAAGLGLVGLKLHETHTKADKMARAAASTNRLTGFGSAVVPLDLCVEAEALGAEIDFRASSNHSEFPQVAKPLFANCEQVNISNASDGRIPLVCESIPILKKNIGTEVIVGAFVPGPFTLLSILLKPDTLMLDLKRNPASVQAALDAMADVITRSALAYHQAGADMLTIHEMGGSPGVLGPKRFETFVLPPLQKVLAVLPRPRILSVCGNTNGAMPILAQAGADAINVDQLNNLAASRASLPDTLLFGNIDPVGMLANGSPAEVRQAVAAAIAAGADAVWPGCDLYPLTPIENLKAMVSSAQNS
jgi:[methyl-Co(III) methanol-specific corrinoid protein]:coenzyme M methyltransferase